MPSSLLKHFKDFYPLSHLNILVPRLDLFIFSLNPSQLTEELPLHTPKFDGVPRNWSITNKLTQETQKEPCFVFNNHFSPVMGLPQAQLLTNTLVRWSLPQAVLDHTMPTTSHEDDRVKE